MLSRWSAVVTVVRIDGGPVVRRGRLEGARRSRFRGAYSRRAVRKAHDHPLAGGSAGRVGQLHPHAQRTAGGVSDGRHVNNLALLRVGAVPPKRHLHRPPDGKHASERQRQVQVYPQRVNVNYVDHLLKYVD